MKQELTDKSLLESISRGSEKAFRLLYDRHNRILLSQAALRTSSPDAAMEITQDLWMKVWTSPATVKVDEHEDAGRFLLKYLSFRVLDHFRHQSRQAQVVVDDDMVERCAEELSYTHVSEELEAADVQHLLDEALKQLPPFSREVFLQRWNEHRSVKEVAEQLHADPHTVRIHYGNALRHIRYYVETQYTRRHISENTYLLFMFIMQTME